MLPLAVKRFSQPLLIMSENVSEKNIYAVPKIVTELDQCGFYHTMEIPEHGVVEGEWDLRDNLVQAG